MNQFLRQIEQDTADIIENEVGCKAVVVYGDGKEQTKSALDPAQDLMCWVVQESRTVDRETGYDMVSDRPVATFRKRALERIPTGAERCFVKVQMDVFSDELTTYQVAGPPKSGKTIGFVNFQLQSVSQI